MESWFLKSIVKNQPKMHVKICWIKFVKESRQALPKHFSLKTDIWPRSVHPVTEFSLCNTPTARELFLSLPHVALWSGWWGRRQPLLSPACFSSWLLHYSHLCSVLQPDSPFLHMTLVLSSHPQKSAVTVHLWTSTGTASRFLLGLIQVLLVDAHAPSWQETAP